MNIDSPDDINKTGRIKNTYYLFVASDSCFLAYLGRDNIFHSATRVFIISLRVLLRVLYSI